MLAPVISAPKTAVENFTAEAINATHAWLHWKNLTLDQAGGYPNYQVSLSVDGRPDVVLNVSSPPIVVGNLTSTEYIVKVVAFTEGGNGPKAEGKKIPEKIHPVYTLT